MKAILPHMEFCLLLIALLGFAALRWGTNVRNLLGIRKNLVETEKARYELEKAKALIRTATDDEVSRFDPKRRVLRDRMPLGRKNGLDVLLQLWLPILIFLLIGLLKSN